MGKGKSWAEKEEQALKELYKKRVPTETILKAIPNRSRRAIYMHAITLGIKKLEWTNTDDIRLKEFWGKTTRQQLKNEFPYRTWISIRERARMLHISKGYNTALEFAEELTLTEMEKAYIAGFIDGEGTVTLTRHKNRWHSERPRGIISTVRIHNTNKEVMKWIQTKIGGILRTANKKHRPAHWRTVYLLDITKMLRIRQLLTLILPYLIVKRKNAELVLEYCNLRIAGKPKFSNEEIEIYTRFLKENHNMQNQEPIQAFIKSF